MGERPSEAPKELGMTSLSRHAKPLRDASEADPISPDFPELTQKGVEQAEETAQTDLLEILDRAPEGTVMFIGTKTDQERTGQTAEIYGNKLKEIAHDRKGLIVFTKSDVDQIVQTQGTTKGIAAITDLIHANPDKKIVIDYPLYIKQLGYEYQNRWTEDGKKTEYFDEILKKHNGNHAEGVHDWMQNNGVLITEDGRTIEGPKPEDVAKQYLEGIKRVHDFAKGQIEDRPIIIHGVGHQWDLDAVATYLAKGHVTYEDFLDVMGRSGEDVNRHPIGESEVISDISIDPKTNQATVSYRGESYQTKLN